MLEMEKMAAQLPRGIGFSVERPVLEERISGNQAPMLYRHLAAHRFPLPGRAL